MIDLTTRPVPLFRRLPCNIVDNRSQQFRALWKNWVWKTLRLTNRLQPGYRSHRLGEQTVQRDIKAKARSLHAILFYLHLHPRQGIRKVLRIFGTWPEQLHCARDMPQPWCGVARCKSLIKQKIFRPLHRGPTRGQTLCAKKTDGLSTIWQQRNPVEAVETGNRR